MENCFDITPLASLPHLCALAAFVLFIAMFLWACLIDARERLIPNAAVIVALGGWCGAFALAFIAACFRNEGAASASASLVSGVLSGGAGAFGLATLAFIAGAVTTRIAGRPALGMGDVKLLFVMGLYLGFLPAAASLCAACALSAAYAIARTVVSCLCARCGSGDDARAFDGTFPFAPFLLAGMLVVLAGAIVAHTVGFP